jgi:hypothetical protein
MANMGYAQQPAQGFGYPQPQQPSHQPPPQQPAPYAQPPNAGAWGWNQPPNPAPPMHPPQQPQPYQTPYGFAPAGYVPGARVQVTWSNGQRYPATVSQVAGTQCLVVFPDGQQHWVESHFLSPS